MAFIILIALILFSGGLAGILLRNHLGTLMPGPTPDNVIVIADWSRALEQRRHRNATQIFVMPTEASVTRPGG